MSDLIDRDYMLSQIEKAKAENRPFDYDSLIDFVKVLPNANKAELEEIEKELEEIEKELDGIKDFEVIRGGLYVRQYEVAKILEEHKRQAEAEGDRQ